jgi:hypothetical protein
MDTKEAKALWAGFTRDALQSYTIPEEVEDDEDLINDMVDLASSYADAMLEEFESRFEGGKKRTKRKKKKKVVEEEDPDDDEDEDD